MVGRGTTFAFRVAQSGQAALIVRSHIGGVQRAVFAHVRSAEQWGVGQNPAPRSRAVIEQFGTGGDLCGELLRHPRIWLQIGITRLHADVSCAAIARAEQAALVQSPSQHVAGPEEADFPGLHQAVECPQCLLKRCLTVIRMGIIKIDHIRAEPLQAFFTLLFDLASAKPLLNPGHGQPNFCGKEKRAAVAAGPHPATDE